MFHKGSGSDIQQEEKSELIEIVEEFNQTTESIKARIKQGKKGWMREASLFSGIALVLSIMVSSLLAIYLENIGAMNRIVDWFERSGATHKMRETIANPLLVVYSMLYGGDIQVYFIFNKMDEYRFTVMLPLFFIGITIFILWVSEQIRYAITKKTRDMYSNIAIASINGLIVILTAFLLSKQIVIRGDGLNVFMQGSKLQTLYDQYINYVARPSLRVFSTVDSLRLWGMSFTLTLFTLTFCAKKRLVFRKYDNVKTTFIYIMKMIFIAVAILALVTVGKVMFTGSYMPSNWTQIHMFLQEFMFLIGVFLCALLTGHISFITYLVDANNLMELRMEIFTMEACFKKNVSYLDNPVGSYYFILMILILGVILLGSFKHFRGRGIRFKQGIAESLMVASILSLSIALFSKLGAISFRLDCDTTNRRMNFNQLIAGIGATNFWKVATKVFIISLILFILGWALSQLCPRFVNALGKIPDQRWSYIIWAVLIAMVALTIAITINPEVVAEINKMYGTAIKKSQINILLRIEELFR